MSLNEPFINMIIIVFLIGISLTIAIIFLSLFYWTTKSGQYDDTYTPSVRILFDNKVRDPEKKVKKVNEVSSK